MFVQSFEAWVSRRRLDLLFNLVEALECADGSSLWFAKFCLAYLLSAAANARLR